MKIRHVAVIGAGNMGSGIAQKIATCDIPVTLIDTTLALAERGKQRIESLLVQARERRIFTAEQVDAILGRVTPSGALEDAAGAGLVIEAVFEDRAIKQDLFRRLGGICPPATILATNTSSFLVRELAAVAAYPERVIGLHFFYHPAKNRLVEVIGHAGSSPEVLRRAWAFQELTGKTPIASADAPGFVVNRFFVPWLNEAVRLLEEGYSIATIEAAAKQSFGIGMGPFELMNVTGVPITMHATASMAESIGPFYATAAALKRQGEANKPWVLEGDVDAQAFDAVSDTLWGVVFHITGELVTEGVCSLEDVDIGARVGLRWPVGPFDMANQRGMARVGDAADRFARRYNLEPPPRLVQQVESGKPWPLRRVRLDVEAASGLATILINRPDQLNALDPETVTQLESCFEAAQARSDVKAIVIAGAGKAFVAGADVKFFVDKIHEGDIDSIVAFAAHGQQVFRRIERSSKPVICKLDGIALGGGAELALACHTIVATPQASIAFPESGIGIYPGLGGTQRLTRRLGMGLARYVLLSGFTLNADDLARLALAWRVVPGDEMGEAIAAAVAAGARARQQPASELAFTQVERALASALEPAGPQAVLAASVPIETRGAGVGVGAAAVAAAGEKFLKVASRKAPRAVHAIMALTRQAAAALSTPEALDAGLAAETVGLRSVFDSRDALEGLSAVLERRRPTFTGN